MLRLNGPIMTVVYVTILVACVTQNTITSSQVGNTERDPTFVRSTLADGKPWE